MARKHREPHGRQQQAREVVLTVDRRLLYLVGLLLAFVAAVALGTWTVQRQAAGGFAGEPAGDQAAAGTPAAPAQAAPGLPTTIPDDAARATALALGLPTSVAIVQPIQQVTSAPAPAGLDVPGVMHEVPPDQVTPVDDVQKKLLDQPGVKTFEMDPDRKIDASKWSHDTMAHYPDPNVTDPSYTPVRLEHSEGPYEGPRVAISELNELYTYDYGLVPTDRVAVHEFRVANVGTKDLVVGRIYAACGCTASRVGDMAIAGDGFLPQPLVLKAGESEVFSIEYDPRADPEAGTVAKYIQIFCNDPTRAVFDPADPNSHEVRFRIVIEPESE